ncbi:transcription initiation factor TFIID subunit 3-like isoform X2 [Scylla paramamosain]|uniref:transcription initiation factor TFIID subunit 3-like isoform X2 n=1 Tax=Scylla paramamosain TaxID=85552 RepID=UPI00308369BC
MAGQFTSEILKICVGQICQSIGYQGVFSTPLEVLTDLLHRYLTELCRLTHRYTEHFGRTEPSLDDLGLAFMDMGISVPELEDYFSNVDCPPFPHPLPALPVTRPSNLNFLKPGAREILSRPIHIHEHLPPMYPEKEEEEVDVKVNAGLEDGGMGDATSPTLSPQPALKRPADSEVSPAKKPKFSLDDEGQPVREIVSVMMTTSGFISSAREGKLPEACCPDIPMAAPRSTSPSTVGKKKLTVEKLIRQKNSQVGLGGARSCLARPPRPNKVKGNKDRVIGKGLKIPKLPSRPLSLPKGAPPGSSPLPPKLKMPLLKPAAPKPPKIPSPKPSAPPKSASTPKVLPPKTSQSPHPQTPKSASPKIKVPKPPRTPKAEGKAKGKPRDGEKEGEGAGSGKKVKKEKEGSKKEGKKESKKDKDGVKRSKEARRDKEGRKEGTKETKKEKEMKKERDRERERELIIALASSSAVTVTSIPAPTKAPDSLLPPGPEKAEGKSKLSIFKKIKNKDAREDREAPGPGPGPNLPPAPAQPSRDSSPDLMIDETPGRGQRRPPEEPPPEAPPPPPPPPEEVPRSPADYPPYQEDLSPPTTPSTPRTPEVPSHLPPHRSPEKRRGRDKGREKRPRKDRSKSPKGGPFSPGPRDVGEPDPPERPKTPEVGLPMEDMGVPPGAPFLPAFPTAPGFIPPFSRFPFLPPFGGPPPRPGMVPPLPDLRLPPHHPFMPRPPLKRPLEEDRLSNVEDGDHLERPPTPRHPREGSPLMIRGHGSPMRSPSPSTPPRPRTPAHHSPPPQAPPRPHPRPDKPEKTEKEKKKEHKKEKKEKEKEKEKVKKKKDKKDKEKEKDKSDKRKEKEKLKQEKKEKKVKREKEEGGEGPKITMKLPSPTTSDAPPPTTPKLVIKPVVKHDEPPPPPPPSTQDDQPGSPEIAKISALITRPPRSQQKRAESPPALPVLKIKDVPNPVTKHKEVKDSGHTPAKVKEVPPLKIKNPTTASSKASSKVASTAPKQSVAKLPTSPKASTCPKPPPPPPTPKAIDDKKIPGIKKPREKKEKKEKKKDVPSSSSNPLVGSISKPGMAASVTGEPSYPAHSPMPLVSPPLDTPKPSKKQEQKGTGLLTETVGPIGHFVDDQGNEVWICPTCGKQDDGSPMIGCDTCDDWYHWVCVGIQVPPNDDVNWYCPRCLSQHKQRGAPPEKKKRGRKKK